MSIMSSHFSQLNTVVTTSCLAILSVFSLCCQSSRIISSPITNNTVLCKKNLHMENGLVIFENFDNFQPGAKIRYKCNNGYQLVGPKERVCSYSGVWEPYVISNCVKVKLKCDIPLVANGQFSEFGVYTVGDDAEIICHSGNHVYIECGSDGYWRYGDGREYNQNTVCPATHCKPPPQIPNGEWLSYDTASFQEGAKVTYQCFSDYRLVSDSGLYNPYLTCINAHWQGDLPSCILSVHCSHPVDIPHGSWMSNDQSKGYTYSAGSTVVYTCNHGYKVLGESVMECLSDQLWSHIAPQCIPYSDNSVYCDDPLVLMNGKCGCNERDLSYCQPFMPGLKVACACNTGYQIRGDNRLTCQADGTWSPSHLPFCEKERDPQASSSFHVSTLAIVVATACSILGVLLFVMVIVVFRRHKPRPRLLPGAPTPPPYTRVHNNSISDHDRLALISCDSRRFPLPSYEEATAASTNPLGSNMAYRPLPPVPTALRGAFSPVITLPNVSDHQALSEFYGSRDTVNVSMSDASTSVTVETYDSAVSNPSVSSRRVHTGSLHSTSTCSIVTEDAPLIDGNHSDGRSSQEPTEIIEENTVRTNLRLWFAYLS